MFEQQRQNYPEIGQQDPDVVRLVRPEGTYTIMYGTHTVVQNPNQLPDKLDGIFLETGENKYIEEPLETIQKLKEGSVISLLSYRSVVQYTDFLKSLEKRRVPIYFADLHFTDFNSMNLAQGGLVAATLTEGGAAAYIINDLYRSPRVSRRTILKSLVALWGAAEITALFPIIPPLAAPSQAVHPEVTTLIQLYKEQYEFLVNILREVSIAHKLGWLMQTLGGNPDLGVVIGRGHRDTEGKIRLEGRITQPSQERFEYLKSVKGELPLSVQPESFYRVIECRFNGWDWQVANTLEISELKSLVA